MNFFRVFVQKQVHLPSSLCLLLLICLAQVDAHFSPMAVIWPVTAGTKDRSVQLLHRLTHGQIITALIRSKDEKGKERERERETRKSKRASASPCKGTKSRKEKEEEKAEYNST